MSRNLASNFSNFCSNFFGFLLIFWQLFGIPGSNFPAFYVHNRDMPNFNRTTRSSCALTRGMKYSNIFVMKYSIKTLAERVSAEFLHHTYTVFRGKVVNYMCAEDKPLEKKQNFCIKLLLYE